MLKYIFKRLIRSVFAFFICSLLTYLIIRKLPGSIAYSVYGANIQRLTAQEIERIEQALISDQSILGQYTQWLLSFFRGDWGYSFNQQQEIFNLMKEQSFSTILLVGLALVITNLGVSIIFIFNAAFSTYRSKLIKGLLFICMIVPNFWIGFLLIWLLSSQLQIFPLYGLGDGTFMATLYHLILPSVTLALPAIYYGVSLLESEYTQLRKLPFFEYLKARKILHYRFILHCFPHLSLVYLQLNGILVTSFIGGTLAIESVFSIPGIGKLTVQATKMHDYSTLLVIVLVTLGIIMIMQLLIDLISCWFDPRVYKSLKE